MWRYKLLLTLLFIPLAVYTLWQSIRAVELRYFFQRLALFYSSKTISGGILIHAASVGEVNAITPLILKIKHNNPNLPITITSNTVTSYNVLKRHLGGTIQHVYFSLDYSWMMNRLINKIKPTTLVIVETEFWPNLYTLTHKKKIPLVIINGRISEKTLHAKEWLKDIYATVLPFVTKVYARSETDASRFIELGLSSDKLTVLGNIKFSSSPQEDIKALDLSRPYVLAASTREDEEQHIVTEWLKSDKANTLLVIVPRHPKRLIDILNQLNMLNINIAVRSKNEPVTTSTEVYIADTIGELKQFIAGARFVLMGGSFVEKGGHNILEVAQLGKAVIFGPDMRNFNDEAELFVESQSGIQCDLNKLTDTFNYFLQNESNINTIEKNTTRLIEQNKDIINHYYLALNNHINLNIEELGTHDSQN